MSQTSGNTRTYFGDAADAYAQGVADERQRTREAMERFEQTAAAAQAKAIEHAVAAERERIRELAIHRNATYSIWHQTSSISGRSTHHPFADLLADPSVPAVPTEGTTP